MTAPASPNDSLRGDRARRLRRRVALLVLVALIIVSALLTPELTSGRTGDQRLTTYSAEPLGARLLYELAERLGWHVERRSDDEVTADAQTVIAILDPPQPLAGIEAHRVLERVRAGSGLLYVMNGRRVPLDDSLHLKLSRFGGTYVPASAGTVEAPRASRPADSLRARRFARGAVSDLADSEEVDTSENEGIPTAECAGKSRLGGAFPLWGDDSVHLLRISFTRPRPADAVIFARAKADPAEKGAPIAEPAAVGFALGRGRVVVLSDPDLLRNDVLRVCHWGLDVVAVRMLEYLGRGGPQLRDRLVFDEYHQGYGAHPGTMRAIALYLAHAPSGHVLLQCLLGGLVLLLALGPRAVPAQDPERVERRSPLEQVGALARAYARVGATRTATERLLHGVRRRVERATRGGLTRGSDVAFLDDAARRAPDLDSDIALIKRALTTSITPRELQSVGGALSRVEQTLQTQRR